MLYRYGAGFLASVGVIGLSVYGVTRLNVRQAVARVTLAPNATVEDNSVDVQYEFHIPKGYIHNTEQIQLDTEKQAYDLFEWLNGTDVYMDAYYRTDNPSVNSLDIHNIKTSHDDVILGCSLTGIMIGSLGVIYSVAKMS